MPYAVHVNASVSESVPARMNAVEDCVIHYRDYTGGDGRLSGNWENYRQRTSISKY